MAIDSNIKSLLWGKSKYYEWFRKMMGKHSEEGRFGVNIRTIF